MHSACIRNPKEREKNPFLARLTKNELSNLVDFYLEQPAYHAFRMFAVVVDKRYLHDYYDEQKLHRKAYELLIERIEWFMRNNHPKHRALMVLDDTSRQMNRALAMKHSLFQRQGTSNGSRISHIVELPMFVDSSLSNGVQLADLCAYNVYRAFRDNNLEYEYFRKISGCFYQERDRQESQIEGLKIFPDNSPLKQLAEQLPEQIDARRG